MKPSGPREASPKVDGRVIAAGGILVVAAVAAYCRTFQVPALLDDLGSIRDNPSLHHLSDSLWPPGDRTVGGRPVLNVSLAINYMVSRSHLWSYHALNLALHVLSGLTLFGILRRTFAPEGRRTAAVAFFAALLWTVHPLLTESVTYVIQRAESLMGLFYLLTLYCFIRGASRDGSSRCLWFGASVGACLLGMGTKEVMVSAPLIVLLYDRTFLAGSFAEAWRRRRGVYAALAATWLLLVALVIGTHGRAGTAGFASGIPWRDYALTQLSAVVRYLGLCFWPRPLVFDYGVLDASGFAQAAPAGVVIAALLAATLWALVRKPALGFLGVCFFAVLAPSSSFVPVATETMAEHRMYLALIPVVVLFTVTLHRWLGRLSYPLFALAAASLLCATLVRNEDYRSEEGIWRDTVAKAPLNERAHGNLGDVLDAAGRTEEALSQREAALSLKPDSAFVHNNLGTTLARTPGRLSDAVFQFEEALRLYPDYAEADNNLGNALAAEGLPARAVDRFKAALRLKPDFISAHNNLGNALAQIPGRMDEAVAQYREALRLNPDLVSAHNNLGSALARMPGQLDAAIAQFGEALRLDPNYLTARVNLGNALAKTPGRLNEAVAQYEAAVRLKPDAAALRVNLALMLLNLPGRTGDAAEQLRAALRLQPDNAQARRILEGMGQRPP